MGPTSYTVYTFYLKNEEKRSKAGKFAQFHNTE